MMPMLAGLHGRWLPRRDDAHDAVPHSDLYSLFHARSAALHWLTEPGSSPQAGLWGMNDAGERRATDDSTVVAWFQVTLTGGQDREVAPPIQPLLACIQDTMTRAGTLELEAVTLLVPEGTGPASSREALGRLATQAEWFADHDQSGRRAATLTLAGPLGSGLRDAGPSWVTWLSDQLLQEVATPDPASLGPVEWTPDGLTQPHLSDQREAVSFVVDLAEWSLASIGWLAEFVCVGGRAVGVGAPFVITISAHPTDDGGDRRSTVNDVS